MGYSYFDFTIMKREIKCQVKNRLALLPIVVGFISLLQLLNGCVTDQYDLSKGLNADITVGGDSLMIPLGTTKKIYLKDLVKGADSALLLS